MWYFRKHKNKLDISKIQGPQFDGRLRRKIGYNLESWSGLLLNALAHLFEELYDVEAHFSSSSVPIWRSTTMDLKEWNCKELKSY